jgi:hypothetical protein
VALTAIEIQLTHNCRVDPELWGSEVASSPPSVLFNDVMDSQNSDGMAQLTTNIVSQPPQGDGFGSLIALCSGNGDSVL